MLEGTVTGDRLRGTLKSVNVPARRPDNVNCPAFRGIIVTDDGAKIYFEFNGIAVLRPEDKARVFTTSLSLRTGDARYAWVTDTIGAVEDILNTTTEQALVRPLRARTNWQRFPCKKRNRRDDPGGSLVGSV
jgi:hypothetical protein